MRNAKIPTTVYIFSEFALNIDLAKEGSRT